MRAVTDVRCLVQQNSDQSLDNRLRELESDYAAARLALPTWYSNPARNFASGETEREHQDRLDTLLLSSCACLLISITAAYLVVSNSPEEGYLTFQEHWRTILAKASEIVLVVQNWKPNYFNSMNPMCSYIVFLTGAILALDRAILSGAEPVQSNSSGDLDLLALFLRQVGHYWAVGSRLAESLASLRLFTTVAVTCRDVTIFLWQLTASSCRTNSWSPSGRFNGAECQQHSADSIDFAESQRSQRENTSERINISDMNWVNDIFCNPLGESGDADMIGTLL